MYALCAAFALLLATGASPGCAPTRPAIDPQRGPATATVLAEWRDVERSVEVAVRRAEMSILDTRISAAEKRFRLLTVRDEPAWLIARPGVESPFAADAEIPIHLETSVGLFGNPTAERRLLRAVSNRLRQLRGQEWAPS